MNPMLKERSLTKTLYKIDDIVLVHGMYMCVPCGYVQEFQEVATMVNQ